MKYIRSSIAAFVTATSIIPTTLNAQILPNTGVQTCDTSYELAPSGTLEPGAKVWVREPDIKSDPNAHSACTAHDNLFPMDEPRVELCTVGPFSLNIGKGPHGNSDQAVILGRDQDGQCYIIPKLAM